MKLVPYPVGTTGIIAAKSNSFFDVRGIGADVHVTPDANVVRDLLVHDDDSGMIGFMGSAGTAVYFVTPDRVSGIVTVPSVPPAPTVDPDAGRQQKLGAAVELVVSNVVDYFVSAIEDAANRGA